MKTCSKCKESKPLSEFYKDKSKKDGYKYQCKECVSNDKAKKEYQKHYRETHKEYFKEKHAEYRERNRENLKERSKEYRLRNPEKSKEYYNRNREKILDYQKQYKKNNRDVVDRWKEDNHDKVLLYKKTYREKHRNEIYFKYLEYIRNNPDVNRARAKRYYYKNIDKCREMTRIRSHKRRAKEKENGGSYTLDQWEKCMEFFDKRCAYTGEPLTEYHVDHIVPISKGGSSDIYNVLPCLPSVNISKSNNDLNTWYKDKEYFSENRLNKIYEWIEYAKTLL